MDVLKDFTEYVMCAVYSLNRGERLNIHKSLIYMFKACNSIDFTHFLLTVNSWGGYIFLPSVLFFSELITCLLYSSSLVLWRLSSQWCIPNTNALTASVLDIGTLAKLVVALYRCVVLKLQPNIFPKFVCYSC